MISTSFLQSASLKEISWQHRNGHMALNAHVLEERHGAFSKISFGDNIHVAFVRHECFVTCAKCRTGAGHDSCTCLQHEQPSCFQG